MPLSCIRNIFAVPHNPETRQEAIIIHLTYNKPVNEERRDLHNVKEGPETVQNGNN